MGAVVVHRQVQILLRIGAVELTREDQELLSTVLRLDRPGDAPGRDLQRCEPRRGAMPRVVVGAFSTSPGQHRGGAVGRLNLGFSK